MKNSLQGWSCSQRSGIWWSCRSEKISASEITGCHLGNLVSLTDHCDFILHLWGQHNKPSYQWDLIWALSISKQRVGEMFLLADDNNMWKKGDKSKENCNVERNQHLMIWNTQILTLETGSRLQLDNHLLERLGTLIQSTSNQPSQQ